MENELKFCIKRMNDRSFSLITNNSTLCVIFTIKAHYKSKIDTRNEFTDLEIARHMYSSYDKKFLGHGSDKFSNMADGGHLEF